MKLTIEVEATVLTGYLKAYPQKLDANTKLFIDRVGYKLDAEAKRAAPAITGNLRRNIIYRNGELVAHANYSGYVHGAPFHKNKMKRRETPFITKAIASSDTFIKSEAQAMIRRVLS